MRISNMFQKKRSKYLGRISQESITKWGKMVSGDHSSVDIDTYHCIQVEV